MCPFNCASYPGIVELPGGPSAPLTPASLTTTSPPPPLASHSLSPLPSGGQLLFGGTTATGPNPFAYTLSNSTWTQQFPTFSPTARTDGSLLLDPVRQNNVLFGGRNPLGTALSDSWVWANGQWTFISTPTSPSPRSGHRMAFDRTRGVGILFGGKGGTNSPLADTWSWNGTAWSQLSPATSPPARFDHQLAYDPLRDRIVLFGGEDATGLRNDVWEWDGATWSQVTPAPQTGFSWGPSARARHAMEYDRLAERVVVHGGDGASACQSDVWSWDGSVWTMHLPGASPMPAARSRSQLVADTSTGRLLLFGGACSTTFFNDAWTFELPVYSRVTSYGTGCAGTLGVPTLAPTAGSKPIIGQTFSLEIGNIPGSPFNFPFGVFDLQRTTFAGLPIPADLSFVGLPGCSALTGAFWSVTLSPAGTATSVTWPLAIPNLNVFLGENLYLQAAILDNFGGRFASLTNGVEARMGNR